MLSVPDIAIIGAVALLVFGPEQLPKVARRAGQIMRDVQNTSNQFIREMEKAADEHEPPAAAHAPAADPDPHAWTEPGAPVYDAHAPLIASDSPPWAHPITERPPDVTPLHVEEPGPEPPGPPPKPDAPPAPF